MIGGRFLALLTRLPACFSYKMILYVCPGPLPLYWIDWLSYFIFWKMLCPCYAVKFLPATVYRSIIVHTLSVIITVNYVSPSLAFRQWARASAISIRVNLTPVVYPRLPGKTWLFRGEALFRIWADEPRVHVRNKPCHRNGILCQESNALVSHGRQPYLPFNDPARRKKRRGQKSSSSSWRGGIHVGRWRQPLKEIFWSAWRMLVPCS